MKNYTKNLVLLAAGLIMGSMSMTAQNYIEVCGIKWAKGNLQYDAENGGAAGFQTNWKIADSQSDYFNSVSGLPSTNTKATASSTQIDHFNWGIVGSDALSASNYSSATSTYEVAKDLDISGKLYTDDCITEYTGSDRFTNSSVNHGDLIYWASKGQYKMPSREEITTLTSTASWQFGYITSNSQDIYGFLFTTPSGTRTTNTTAVQFTETDLNSGLFLPLAGKGVTNNQYLGRRGYYAFSGYFTESSDEGMGIFLLGDVTVLRLYGDNTAVNWDSWTADMGFSMRGVANYKVGDVNDDGKVNMADAIVLLNYVLGDDVDYINLSAADVNLNGSVNISDEIDLLMGLMQ